jgi:hypothetical protein
MRILLLLPGIFTGAIAIATSAAGQNYPWCSNFADGWGGTNCGFTTFEQCMATVHGAGGFCTQNNTYVPPAAAASSRRATRSHRPRKN